MKHLVRFNESYSMDKEVSFTEDLLLKFRDSGELSNYDVKHFGDTIDIDLLFNEQLIGKKKIILLDSIIDRLKKRYKYIYINNNRIFIDIIEKSAHIGNYMRKTLLNDFENVITYHIKGLKKYKKDVGRYKDYIFFTYNETHPPSMYYSIEDGEMIVKTTIVRNFWFKMLDDKDISSYLSEELSKIFNLSISKVTNSSIIPTVNDLVKIN